MTFYEALDQFRQRYETALSESSIRTIQPLDTDWQRINNEMDLYNIAVLEGSYSDASDHINNIIAILAGNSLIVTDPVNVPLSLTVYSSPPTILINYNVTNEPYDDSFDDAVSDIHVYNGVTEDTNNWTFTIDTYGFVTGSIQNDNELKIDSMTRRTGYVIVKGTKSGVMDIYLRIPVQRVYDNRYVGEDLFTNKKTTESFPVDIFLIKNEEVDNTVSTTDSTFIEVDSIDTGANTITLSWLPNISTIWNPETDKEWMLADMDTHTNSDYYSGGFYQNIFKITGGSYATKTLNYEFITGVGGTETNTIAGNKMFFWNPDYDGYTRYSGNPVLDKDDFTGITGYGSFSDFVAGGIYQKDDDSYVLIGYVTGGGTNPRAVYATSTDLLTWSAVQNELFTSGRPSWASASVAPMGNPIYMDDEEMFIMAIRGKDASGNDILGWVKFDGEDIENTYSFAPSPFLDPTDLDGIVDGWRSATLLDAEGYNDISFGSIVENNGVWYLYFDIFGMYYGTHNGGNNSATLSDSTRTEQFIDGEFGNWASTKVYNLTDGSSSTLSAAISVTSGVVTAPLSGGTDNDWDDGDIYAIRNITTRRCFIATAESPYKKFKLFKILQDIPLDNDGSLGNSHLQSGQMFIHKGVVNCFVGETSATNYSGSKGHRVMSLYRYDPTSSEFIRHRKSPVFSAWQYGNEMRGSQFDWELYHTGSNLVPWVDEANDKFYLFYNAGNGSSEYAAGVAYRDLDDLR